MSSILIKSCSTLGVLPDFFSVEFRLILFSCELLSDTYIPYDQSVMMDEVNSNKTYFDVYVIKLC